MRWIWSRGGHWLRRLGKGLAFLWILSVVSFGVVKLAPGDVVISLLRIDTIAVTMDEIAALRGELGLDKGLLPQYANYMKGLLRLDLGESMMTGRLVAHELFKAFPPTLLLAGSSLALTALLTLLLGVLSARYADSWIDRFCSALCLAGASIPTFWLGLLLLNVFAARLRLLPSMGLEDPRGLILPAISLAAAIAPPYVKIFRGSLLETARQEFVRSARSRGLSERAVFLRHILRGSLIPLVTILGVSMGSLIGGTVIVEIIFGVPGVGKLAVEAVTRRDYAVIQGYILFIGVFVFLINLAVDLSYRYLDPAIARKEAERR